MMIITNGEEIRALKPILAPFKNPYKYWVIHSFQLIDSNTVSIITSVPPFLRFFDSMIS